MCIVGDVGAGSGENGGLVGGGGEVIFTAGCYFSKQDLRAL